MERRTDAGGKGRRPVPVILPGTHALVWPASGPAQLSEAAARRISPLPAAAVVL